MTFCRSTSIFGTGYRYRDEKRERRSRLSSPFCRRQSRSGHRGTLDDVVASCQPGISDGGTDQIATYCSEGAVGIHILPVLPLVNLFFDCEAVIAITTHIHRDPRLYLRNRYSPLAESLRVVAITVEYFGYGVSLGRARGCL